MRWCNPFLTLLCKWSRGWALLAREGRAPAILYEHVLQNQPQGRGKLGTWLDRRFLAQSRWQACRAAHERASDSLAKLVFSRHRYALDTFVLDLGVGSARYAWPVVVAAQSTTVLCLRRSVEEVELGRRSLPPACADRIAFAIGDRLDSASYLTAREPDAIVCLYPPDDLFQPHTLFTFATLVQRALAPGGLLLLEKPAPRLPPPRSASETRFPRIAESILVAAGFDSCTATGLMANAYLLQAWKLPPTGSGHGRELAPLLASSHSSTPASREKSTA